MPVESFAGFTYPRSIPMLPKGTPSARLAEYRKRRSQVSYKAQFPHFTGPYYQDAPRMAGNGAAFYLGSDFQSGLRWTWADEVEGVRINHTGWFADEDGYGDTIRGIVFRLPHGRGFLAGWSMGDHMVSEVDSHIWGNEADAARAADDEAERVAERNREYNEAHKDDEAA